MKKITLLLLMLLSITAFSQVEIVENFDNAPDFDVPTGWTQTGGFGVSAGTMCGGAGKGIAVVQYPDGVPSVATLTTPNYVAVTNATELTVSFSLNVYTEGNIGWPPPPAAPIDPWGSVVMEYSIDGGANWITGLTINDSNYTFAGAENCYSVPATDLGVLAAGTDFQARFVVTADVNNFVLFTILDNISIVQVASEVPNCDATLISPINGAVGVNPDATLTWQAATGLPTGYSVSIGTSSGANDILDAATTSDTSYPLDGLSLLYETEYFVNIVPFNGIGDATVGCTEESFTTRLTPIDGATCASPIFIDLDSNSSYFNVQNTADFENNINVGPCGGFSGAYMDGFDVFYEITPATDISIDINLLITDGSTGAVHLMNGCPDVATECVAFGPADTQSELLDVVLYAGNTYFLVISSAGFDSTIGYTLVITKNACINPVFTLTPIPDCVAGTYTIDVDVTYLGLANSLTLTGGAGSVQVDNITATGIINIGPFLSGDTIELTLTNDDNDTCYYVNETYYFCPPANDDCGNSIALTVNTDENCTTVYSGTNAGASENAANPIYCEAGFANTNDVWYSFVATNETIILEYLNIETVIGVEDQFNTAQNTELLSGSCGTFTSLACSRYNYTVFNNLTVNDTYYIRNSSRSTDVAHNYDMCLRLPTTPPANDECDGAIALTLSTDETCNNAISGSTLGATTSTDNSCNDQYSENWGDVWYKFTAVDAGVYQLNYTRITVDYEPNLYLKAYSGTCGSLTPVNDDCTDNGYNPQVYFMDAGETVYIMIRTSNAAPNVDFELCIYQLPDAVANNDCSNSIEILESADETGNNMVSGSFENAYPSPENSACSSNNTIWYNFTPTYTGMYHFLTVQTSDYPRLTIYNTDDCANITYDDLVVGTGCYNGTEISPDLVAGQTYLIAVNSYDKTGAFDLTIYPDASLSVESNNFEKFKYYPNPVINTFTVEAKNTISSISVYNIVGQQVQMVNPNNLKATINMDALNNGVYFVTITIDGAQKTIKVIKK